MKKITNKLTVALFAAAVSIAPVGSAFAEHIEITYEHGYRITTVYDENENEIYTSRVPVKVEDRT